MCRQFLVDTRKSETHMSTLNRVLEQLREERARAERELGKIEDAISAVEKLVGEDVRLLRRAAVGRPRRQRGRMSLAARNRIAAAQRARWAKVRREALKKAA
jgi:hypothetical protein